MEKNQLRALKKELLECQKIIQDIDKYRRHFVEREKSLIKDINKLSN